MKELMGRRQANKPFIILYEGFRHICNSFILSLKIIFKDQILKKIIVMRILLLFLVSLPVFCGAQVNRSANEVARESVQAYIGTKLFRDMGYKPGDYGELKSQEDRENYIAWSLIHQFEITDSQFVADKRIAIRKTYNFSFYLDKKLKVIRAESYYRE
jgi:hypothetical protein